MEAPELPEDEWHNYVYLLLSGECGRCECVADLKSSWEGLGPSEDDAVRFSIRAVARLKADGWVWHDGEPYCANCAAAMGLR